jgi:hypothetical protein
MYMAYLYFFCYVVLAVMRQVNEKSGAWRAVISLLNIACTCVNLAPMMCKLEVTSKSI